MMMNQLENKVALITGGASRPGLGSAIADKFASEGAFVFLTDIDENGCNASLDVIKSNGGQGAALKHNVTDEKDWDNVFAAIKEQKGQLDILVNNAGISQLGTIDSATSEEYLRVMDTNMHSVFYGTKRAVAMMRETGKGGNIINMSSISGIVGIPGNVAYSAAKAGVRLMTKTVAMETAKENIRVNSIHPGLIDTNLLAGAKQENAENWDMFVQAIPMGRLGDPEDIANCALFLASDQGKYITGAELVVDGGVTAM
ncbi:short-chain dehydrogenase/reductase SDR [alpha proteobacterium IMCC14465]|uniref:Short-chain dehydrogenase/reductase SDR n=1 Tax=alpha proteobacterium IMCC14465 TaxID=1220535 RepID=J9DVX0_9PROT|nr:short-chain dehydrogenase/reductase SDR [alpha proteobacterium IMCC14465]